MRSPSQRGTPIDARRYRRWTNRFGAYRDPVTNVTIEGWIGQFDDRDKDLAARILDSVEFYGQAQIHAAYRQALGALQGWNDNPVQRQGKWCFAAMTGSAGESGDAMLYQFRVANGLDNKKYNDTFANRSELFRRILLADDDPKKLGDDATIVLLDDFSGTGKQVCDAWNDPPTSFGALLAGVGKVYLIVVAASRAARTKIANETSFPCCLCIISGRAITCFRLHVRTSHLTSVEGYYTTEGERTTRTRKGSGNADCYSSFSIAHQTIRCRSFMSIITPGPDYFPAMIKLSV